MEAAVAVSLLVRLPARATLDNIYYNLFYIFLIILNTHTLNTELALAAAKAKEHVPAIGIPRPVSSCYALCASLLPRNCADGGALDGDAWAWSESNLLWYQRRAAGLATGTAQLPNRPAACAWWHLRAHTPHTPLVCKRMCSTSVGACVQTCPGTGPSATTSAPGKAPSSRSIPTHSPRPSPNRTCRPPPGPLPP
jgi:hypothetical protein